MYLYSALFVVYLTLKALRHGSHSVTCNCYLQLHQCLPLPRKRSPDGSWRLPRLRLRISNCSRLLLIYLPRKDERLSRPGWLTYSGRFTHISGHPSAALSFVYMLLWLISSIANESQFSTVFRFISLPLSYTFVASHCSFCHLQYWLTRHPVQTHLEVLIPISLLY